MMKFQISFQISSLVETLQTAVTESSWKFVLFMPSYLNCSDLFATFCKSPLWLLRCRWLFHAVVTDACQLTPCISLSLYAKRRTGMSSVPALRFPHMHVEWLEDLESWVCPFSPIFLSLGTVCTTWQGHRFSGNGVCTEFKMFKLTVLNGCHVSWHCVKSSTAAFMGSEKETIHATL